MKIRAMPMTQNGNFVKCRKYTFEMKDRRTDCPEIALLQFLLNELNSNSDASKTFKTAQKGARLMKSNNLSIRI